MRHDGTTFHGSSYAHLLVRDGRPVGVTGFLIDETRRKQAEEELRRAHADLVDDVRTNGVREPIVMQGRIILDGWARYLAAREAGVSYPVQEYAGDDPLRDIITLNMASRSLNLVERQSIAKKLTKLAPDRADEIGELLDLQQQREAAQ